MSNTALAILQNINLAISTHTIDEIHAVIEDVNFQDHYPMSAFMAADKTNHPEAEYLARRVLNSGKTSDEDKELVRRWLVL